MSKYKKFWGFFLSLFFLWLALRNINVHAIFTSISSVNPAYIFLLILSYTLEMITRAYRWLIIQPNHKTLKKEEIENKITIDNENSVSYEGVNFKYSFYGLIMTFFFNNILPARAGEFFKPFYFAKKKLASSGETLGAVVLERFFDGVMLITLILISFQSFSTNDLLQKASIITAIFYGLVLVGIVIAIYNRDFSIWLAQKVFTILPQKLGDFFLNLSIKFIDGLATVKNFKRFLGILFSSAICWASSALTMWIGFKSFGFEENFIQASFVLTVLSISSMIPASPSGIGIYEYFCIFTLTEVLKHSQDESAAFAIAMHGFQYFYIIVLGLIITILEGINIKEFSPTIANDQDKRIKI